MKTRHEKNTRGLAAILPVPGERRGALYWALGLALSAWGLAAYWMANGVRHLGVDEGVYNYVGWSWRQGLWPYVRNWDHKGPLVYAAAALRTLALGPEGDSLAPAEILLLLLTAALTAWIARRFWGSAGGAAAFAVVVLVSVRRPPETGHLALPALLIAVASAAAVLAAIRSVQENSEWLAAVSGACAAVALLAKPNALAGAVVALAVLACRNPRRTLAWLAGAAVPLLALAAWFAAAGALGAMLEATLYFNRLRGAAIWANDGLLAVAITARAQLASLGWQPAVLLGLAGVVAALWSVWKRRALGWPDTEVILALWLPLELLAFASNGGLFYHAFPVVPAAVIASFFALRQVPWRGTAVVLGACVLVGTALPDILRLQPNDADRGPRSPAFLRIAADIRNSTSPGDSILALSSEGPAMFSYTRRSNAMRYVIPVPLISRGYASEARWREVVDGLERRPPAVVYLDLYDYHGAEDIQAWLHWNLAWFDRCFVPGSVLDRAVYPSRTAFQAWIARRYRLKYCLGDRCLLVPR